MKNLMEACRNWGAEGCHHDVSKWKTIEKSREEKVDKICKNCKSLSFNKCPNCESVDFFVKSDFEIRKKENPGFSISAFGGIFTGASDIFSVFIW